MNTFKITRGYILQEFDGYRCVGQKFVEEAISTWEDEDGRLMHNPPDAYYPFAMQQPKPEPK